MTKLLALNNSYIRIKNINNIYNLQNNYNYNFSIFLVTEHTSLHITHIIDFQSFSVLTRYRNAVGKSQYWSQCCQDKNFCTN